MKPTVPSLLPFLVLSAGLVAQGHLLWESVPSPLSPPARWGHTICPAPGTGDPLLFGGRDGSVAFADAWTFSRNGWQPALVAAGPAPRHGHAMELRVDAITWQAEVVLFGGAAADGSLFGDTWLLTRSGGALAWRQAASAGAPSARRGHAMVFADAASSTSGQFGILLFGGVTAQGPSDETFVLQGERWTPSSAVLRPPAREGAHLLDSAAGVRLIGGVGAGAQARSDEWLWVGGVWRPAGTGPALVDAVATPLSFERGGHLILPGDDRAAVQPVLERTIDGAWLRQSVSGGMAPRRACAATRWLDVLPTTVGSELCETAIAFGGRTSQGLALADTWRLRPQHVAFFEALGGGCGPGPWGPVGPALMIGKVTLGRQSVQRIYALTPATLLGLAIGQLDTGLPTCGLRLEPLAFELFVASAVGLAERRVPVPPLAVLAGLPFDFQAAALEAGAPSGIAFSAVTRLWIGD